MQRKSDVPSSEEHERIHKLYFDLAKGDATVKFVDGSKHLEEVNCTVGVHVRDRLSR